MSWSIFRIYSFLGFLMLLAACSVSYLVPLEATELIIREDLQSPSPVERRLRDKRSIRRIALAINQARATPKKFRTNMNIEFVGSGNRVVIGVNGSCFVKDGVTFCGNEDLEVLVRAEQ